MLIPTVLTIAGSDSGGGAGIQADLKTFQRFEAFGVSVLTAVTAQNTLGVTTWEPISLQLVRDQLDAIAADLRPAATKSGMLGSAELVREVAAGLRRHALRPYVLDPVMVSTSGDRLLHENAVSAIVDELLPAATIVTPNTHEAAILGRGSVENIEQMRECAHLLVHELGAGAALVKGGHLHGDESVDVLYDGEFTLYRHSRIETRSTHGTGCTLSAAIAANLAHGASLRGAVAIALDYVHRAILLAPGHIGAGHGPLNHLA